MPTRPVAVIIGMMGAGKTRVGKEVAQLMSLPFADADVEIEHEVGMRIPEYFERHGEPAFREVESEVIAGMLHGFGGVFALGGGAPMTPAVQDDLKEYIEDGGKVVYLMADPREAMERAHRGGGRPMLQGDANARWKKLYRQRDPVYYRVANVHVETYGQTPLAAARKMMDMITERTVHVTGATIEDYDVSIGEGAMNHLSEVLGPKPVRIALIHTQPVQRHSDRARTLLRQGGYQVSDIVIPDAEAGKTIEVANGIWQRLGDEVFTRRRRRRHGSGRFRGRHMDARRAVRQLPHVAARHGGRLYGRQDRHQHAAGQEPRRVVLHACRRARRPQDTRLAAQRHLHRRAGRGRQIGIHQGPRNPAHP